MSLPSICLDSDRGQDANGRSADWLVNKETREALKKYL